MKSLIGVNGLIEGGKSTVADYLVENYGYTKLSFGRAVKESVIQLFGLNPEQVYTTEGKATIDKFWGITPRDILQRYATEGLRDNFGFDFWVRVLERQVKNMDKPELKIVIDDVRFSNEAQFVKNYGGTIWHVYRTIPDPENKEVHRSELPLPFELIDNRIDNTSSLSNLYIQVNNLILN